MYGAQRSIMPIEQLFSEHDIQNLINKNFAPPFGQRNAALIIGAAYWGLTPSELSLLSLESVMDKNGDFFKVWVLPDYVSYTGEARELQTADHILPILDSYMSWRADKKLHTSNISWYRDSDPKSPFFLNDNGGEFALSLRKKGTHNYQARSMIDKLKTYIKNAGISGATPSTFRDSWVKTMYDNGCQYNELKLISGIKSKETLDRKIRPQQRELEVVFQDVFRRVKLPK